MLKPLCDGIVRLVNQFMWIAFAGMIATVALQVMARNIFQTPMIWTSDVAQLLFAWLIFVGAAIGLRTGAHYVVDILPRTNVPLNVAITWIGLALSVCVAALLVWHGWVLAQIRASGEVQSLGISRFWMFLPIPVSGALMLLFLAEQITDLVRGRAQ